MNVDNLTTQDLYFGPIHLPASQSGFYVDDTTSTSLYLTSDVVADALNNAWVNGKIHVSSQALPFPRPTGTPQILHGDGSPEGLVFASQGSMFMRRDNSGSGSALYAKSSGIEYATGWQPYAGAVSPATTLPATTPADGQTAILVDSTTAPTYAWLLQYSATAGKWIFVGGSPALVSVTAQQSPSSSGSYVDLTTPGPSFTVPRAGSYYVEWTATASAQGNAGLSTASMIVANSTGTQWGTDVANMDGGGGTAVGIFAASELTGLSASDVIKCRYECSASTTGFFRNRRLRVLPVALT